MYAPDASKPGKDDRRSAILEIARAAFLQDGYSGTSMSQIAARVGGSKATLYNYFPSKKELFLAVADAMCTEKLISLFDVGEMTGGIRKALADFIRRFLPMLLAEDVVAFYRLVVAESGRFPEIGRELYEIGPSRGIKRMAEYFERAMETGEIRKIDTVAAAEQFLDLCAGPLNRKQLWNVDVDMSSERLEMHIERIVTTFLAAYGNDAISQAARVAAIR
jgi:AcrR family transcriptional regulator